MSMEVRLIGTYPYTAVIQLSVTFPDGTTALGSGALVGRNDILTATHVIYDPSRGGWASSLKIAVGVDYNSSTGHYESQSLVDLDSFRWEATAWPQQTFAHGDHTTLTWAEAQYDVAMIGLSVAIGEQAGWFGVASGYNQSQWAYQLGYPSGSTGMMHGEAWIESDGYYSVYNAYASSGSDIMGPGSSGGPLYIYQDGVPYIIGVKSSGSSSTSTWADIGLLYDQLAEFLDYNDYLLSSAPQPTTPPPETQPAPSTPPQSDALIELYIAYFNRAPEAAGLQFWQSEMDHQLSAGESLDQALDRIAEQFWPAASQAFAHITGYSQGMSDFDFVAKAYGNVLGRPDAVSSDREGIQFWADQLGGAIGTRGEFINDLIQGAHDYIAAQPQDPVSQYVAAYLDNRLEVARFFAQEGISGALSGDAAVLAGLRALESVTSDPTSVQAAIELIAQAPSEFYLSA